MGANHHGTRRLAMWTRQGSELNKTITHTHRWYECDNVVGKGNVLWSGKRGDPEGIPTMRLPLSTGDDLCGLSTTQSDRRDDGIGSLLGMVSWLVGCLGVWGYGGVCGE